MAFSIAKLIKYLADMMAKENFKEDKQVLWRRLMESCPSKSKLQYGKMFKSTHWKM